MSATTSLASNAPRGTASSPLSDSKPRSRRVSTANQAKDVVFSAPGSPPLLPLPSASVGAPFTSAAKRHQSPAPKAKTKAKVSPRTAKDVPNASPIVVDAPPSIGGTADTLDKLAALASAEPTCSYPMSPSRKIAAVVIALGHVFSVIAVYQMLTMPTWMLTAKWFTAAMIMYFVTGTMGITGGAHRLWSHRAFKARFPARLVYAFANTIANQSSILHWSREHRIHHLYADTAADPYDITRGFFYAHMGWLYAPRTDAFAAAAKVVDMSDMLRDPIVRYQDKYYGILSLLCCFVLPTVVGGLITGQYFASFCVFGCFRWVVTLHVTWSVNSVAHFFGTQPYRKDIEAREIGIVSLLSGGEGWHNFHHVYPWDYAAAELCADVFWRFNAAKFWADMFAAMGQVYDRKTVKNPLRAMQKVQEQTHDGMHAFRGSF